MEKDSRRSAAVEALEVGETRSVRRDDVLTVQRAHPGVKDVLLRLLADQVRRDARTVASFSGDALPVRSTRLTS